MPTLARASPESWKVLSPSDWFHTRAYLWPTTLYHTHPPIPATTATQVNFWQRWKWGPQMAPLGEVGLSEWVYYPNDGGRLPLTLLVFCPQDNVRPGRRTASFKPMFIGINKGWPTTIQLLLLGEIYYAVQLSLSGEIYYDQFYESTLVLIVIVLLFFLLFLRLFSSLTVIVLPMGTGNMMVLLCSAEMLFRVWR